MSCTGAAMINVAIDTNILVYAEEATAGTKHVAALEMLEKLPRETTLIPVQVLGELYRVLTIFPGSSTDPERETRPSQACQRILVPHASILSLDA